ncbi:MAG TPA: hypothetical protein VFJ77_07265, partial [Gaiellaceae bacterium]|nr:hypothetical protein [Gaiellaceae bacterium]
QRDDVDYCLGTGLKAGTKDFAACIRTAGRRKLSAKAQAAVDTCQAQGLTDPNALATCVSGLLTVRIPDPPGPRGPKPKDVQAAFAACLDADEKAGTHSFQVCVKKALAP